MRTSCLCHTYYNICARWSFQSTQWISQKSGPHDRYTNAVSAGLLLRMHIRAEISEWDHSTFLMMLLTRQYSSKRRCSQVRVPLWIESVRDFQTRCVFFSDFFLCFAFRTSWRVRWVCLYRTYTSTYIVARRFFVSSFAWDRMMMMMVMVNVALLLSAFWPSTRNFIHKSVAVFGVRTCVRSCVRACELVFERVLCINRGATACVGYQLLYTHTTRTRYIDSSVLLEKTHKHKKNTLYHVTTVRTTWSDQNSHICTNISGANIYWS